MKDLRFSQEQIMDVLRQAESGLDEADLCREPGISCATFHKGRAKLDGMDMSMMSEVTALEDENRRLHGMIADLSMQADMLRESPGECDAAAQRLG